MGRLTGMACRVWRISLWSLRFAPPDHCTQGDAASVGQHRALDPALAAIRWTGPGFFPHPAASCPWRRRVRANSSRCPAARHRPVIPCARMPRTLRPLSISESAGEPRKTSRAWSPAAHSIDSPCAAQRRWRPSPPGPAHVGYDSPADASAAAVAAAPSQPRARPAGASRRPERAASSSSEQISSS